MGINKGKHGTCGRFLLNPGTKNEQIIPSKVSGIKIQKGDILSIQTAGGGGFGPPEKRQPELVARDCIKGKVSRNQARQIYKVVLTKTNKVDQISTDKLRRGTK